MKTADVDHRPAGSGVAARNLKVIYLNIGICIRSGRREADLGVDGGFTDIDGEVAGADRAAIRSRQIVSCQGSPITTTITDLHENLAACLRGKALIIKGKNGS